MFAVVVEGCQPPVMLACRKQGFGRRGAGVFSSLPQKYRRMFQAAGSQVLARRRCRRWGPHGLSPFQRGGTNVHQKRMPSLCLSNKPSRRPSLVLFGTVPQTAISWLPYVRHSQAQGLDPCPCQTQRCGISTTSCRVGSVPRKARRETLSVRRAVHITRARTKREVLRSSLCPKPGISSLTEDLVPFLPAGLPRLRSAR